MTMENQIEYTAQIIKGRRVLHATQYPTCNPWLWAHIQGRFGFEVGAIGDNGNAELVCPQGGKARLVVEKVQ